MFDFTSAKLIWQSATTILLLNYNRIIYLNAYSEQLQRRGERRATINEEVGGVYDASVL